MRSRQALALDAELLREKLKAAQAEIERLSKDVARYMEVANVHVNENERLRAEVVDREELAKRIAEPDSRIAVQQHHEIATLREENERLRVEMARLTEHCRQQTCAITEITSSCHALAGERDAAIAAKERLASAIRDALKPWRGSTVLALMDIRDRLREVLSDDD